MQASQNNDDLAVTRYCDHGHPSITQRARLLARNADSDQELARATFLWVRDRIPFGLDLFKVKASDTLAKGYGACFNKSLLLTALLRSNQIPARFCSVPVNRWFMKPFAGVKCLLINNPFHHCLVQVAVGGRWSYMEPTLDRTSYEALFKQSGAAWGIEWTQDHQDRLYLEHLQGEPAIHSDIDATIERNVGNSVMPAAMARSMYRQANHQVWARIGLTPDKLHSPGSGQVH